MKTFLSLLCCSLLLLSGCKKEKPVVFFGQLLLSEKYPTPVSNVKIEVYQAGQGSAIGLSTGSTSSSATAVTDANGRFSMSFTPGKSTFIIFGGTSAQPLTLSNAPYDTSGIRFSRSNFPGAMYDAAKPTYIGKLIDTTIIKVSIITDLAANDTIGLQARTLNGTIDKEYIGRTAPAGSVVVLDTLFNLLFTDFDCHQNQFRNSIHAGRKYKSPSGYVGIWNHGLISPYLLSPGDEVKTEITFRFSK